VQKGNFSSFFFSGFSFFLSRSSIGFSFLDARENQG
jgi:hypothetical protein